MALRARAASSSVSVMKTLIKYNMLFYRHICSCKLPTPLYRRNVTLTSIAYYGIAPLAMSAQLCTNVFHM